MRRVLCFLGPWPIYSYPAMLSLGICLGLVVGNVAARAAGLDGVRVYLATLGLLPPALVGSRLLHVTMHWDRYRDDPSRMWRRGSGGAAMYGGLIGAVLFAWPVLRAVDLPAPLFADVATFTALVGMIVTRVGCLLNGCCGGRPTDGSLGMWLPDVQGRWARRWPTQFLEMGFGGMLLAAATSLWPRAPFAGALSLAVVATYTLGRLGLQVLRDPAAVPEGARRG